MSIALARRALALLVLASLAPGAHAQFVSYTGAALPVETFDSLAPSGTSATTPDGWYFAESGSGANNTYAADDGAVISGNTYSYGSIGSSERAFGTLQSGSVVATIGVQLRNDSGALLDSVEVAFTAEHWRRGNSGAVDRLDAEYSTDATSLTSGTWTALDALDISSINTTGSAIALDGNAAANRTTIAGTIAGLGIAPADTFWIRWRDANAAMNDDGLAIDDVRFGPLVDNPPAVASTTPANAATNIGVASNIAINFSEPVTAAGSWYSISCATSGAHPATPSGSAQSYVLDPTTDFTFGETCTVTVVAAQVTDLDGTANPMAADYVFSFTTGADLAPTVASTVPADGATNVALTSFVTITFSEPVTATGTWYTFVCGGNPQPTAHNGGPVEFTIDVVGELPSGATCQVTVVAAQVSDQDGAATAMAADYILDFTAAVDVSPTVASTVPADNASNVGVNANVQVTFSEPVTAPAGAFAITCSPSGAHPFVLTGGPTTFTLNPNTDFAQLDACAVTITASQVVDQDGAPQAMVADYVFDFTASGGAATYYSNVDASNPAVLRATLHDTIDDHTVFPYTGSPTDVWTMIEAGDQDPNDPSRVLDVYFNKSFVKVTERDQGQNVPQGTRYNREHTWPQSLGFSATNGNLGFPNAPRSDGHMLYVSEKDWNADRGNKPFANCAPPTCQSRHTLTHPVTGGAGSDGACNYALGNCNWVGGPDGNQGSFEVWARRKGDVARAVLYMDVRYEGSTAGPDSNTPGQAEPDLVVTDNRSLIQITSSSPAYMGLMSTLVAWHNADPPDDQERLRNEMIYSFQENRNPFIDHPEWVNCLYVTPPVCGGTPPDAVFQNGFE